MNLDKTVLIQGITEPLGVSCLARMQAAGTRVVAGVSPGFGGEERSGVPIFDLVEDAIAAVGPVGASAIVSSPYTAVDAALEAIAAGIRHIVITTANVPPLDTIRLIRAAEATETLVVGPNSPGIIVPGQAMLGLYPQEFYQPGPVGIVSRSSTLAYEVAAELSQAGLGQSICVCIGADRVVGSSLVQWLQILDEDERTEVIVLVGEIGGNSELAAAQYIAEAIDKPTIAYIAGRHAPPDRALGHAPAIVASRMAAALVTGIEGKLAALREANVHLAESPAAIPGLVKRVLAGGDRPIAAGRSARPHKSARPTQTNPPS